MIAIPSPLHPAIVHFPIVLILVGTVVAVAAVFFQKWHLSWVAAGLLSIGALGAIAAAWSGGHEQEMVGELSSQAEQLLDRHEEWGESTRTMAVIAALLACGALAATRFPQAARGVSAAAALAAMTSSYCVIQAGHYGGQLVYKNGVGVNPLAGAGALASAEPANNHKKAGHDED